MGRKNDSLGTRVFSCIMSIVLAVGLMPLPAFAEAAGETAASGDLVVAETPLADSLELTTSSGEQAQDSHVNVAYIQRIWDGEQVVDQPRNISAIPVPTDGSMTGGTFYLNRSVTVDGRICLTDDTDLILGDGRTLNVKGLYIPKGKTLNIYCQSAGTGKLVSQPDDGTAIGAYSGHKGGSVVIHGGNIEATGAKNCAGIGSNDGDGKTSPIVILGGKVTANGGSMGAGIGGGKNCDAGEITIYGGNVTAKGGEDGAGIGGGEHGDGGTITIYGGTVNANKDETNENGAGIGGGDGGEGGTITINGGTVNTWSRDGAGIGGGEDGDGGTITINGGIVECADKGVAQGARIGGGNNGDGGTITINGGTVSTWFRDGAGIGGGEDGDSGDITINGGAIRSYYAEGSDGNGAAIGGGNHSGDGDTITITGGSIHAYSKHGAGIGGGRGVGDLNPWSDGNSGQGGTITITGGQVYASCEYGYGIGAGGELGSFAKTPDHKYVGNVGTVTIGGNAYVEAEGGIAGIGGDGDGTITIEGGKVIARGLESKKYGRGIMMIANEEKGMGTLYIKGGHVEAYGYDDYPGISSEYMNISITGGDVYAYSPEACGIGGGQDRGTYGKVMIEGEGTVVRAKSDEYAGIDGGYHGDRTIRGSFNFGPGITLELWSPGLGDKHQHSWCHHRQAYYEGSKYTVGATKETARILPDDERQEAYLNDDYTYMLIEPCNHKDAAGTSLLDAKGRCIACAYQEYPATYDEYSWNEGQLTKETKSSPAGTQDFPVSNNKSLAPGWYYVKENITIDGRLTLTGNTNLILADGYSLDTKGVYIPQGSTLTIYGQSEGTGKLVSKASSGAGIGAYGDGHKGGNVVIHGGTITATGGDNCAGIGGSSGNNAEIGNFTMYHGTVTATGGDQGAGIGGGRDCGGGTIDIYGGTITATGKDSAAGIGGGDANKSGDAAYRDTSTINIYGGTITATSKSGGAGIGGGEYGSATISISGGTITATGKSKGAGIGNGAKGAESAVTISGGVVTATGGSDGGAGIGNGADGGSSTVNITGGRIIATGSTGAGIGNGKSSTDSAITLGWTEATKGSIGIDASSYSGTVTLEKDFHNNIANFPAHEIPDLASLAKGTLRADGVTVLHWSDLQNSINGAGNSLKLENDYAADASDTALQIVNGKNITIDLNGHTLDRNLSEPKEGGSVFHVDASSSLTIIDSRGGGTITGGNNQGKGGAIDCAGIVTLNGGYLWRSEATAEGGGIYVAPNATLNMNSGMVVDNTCGTNGGGVYVSDTATMTVSGNPVVMSNKRNADNTESDNNVHLMGSSVIGVTGELVEFGANIYVSRDAGPGIFTTGYSDHNTEYPSKYFRSNDPEYNIVLSNSEARIDTSVPDVKYISYEWNNRLESSEQYTDNEWMAWPDGATNVPGGMYVLNKNVTVDGLVSLGDNTSLILCDGCTLNVKGLYIPKGKTLTVYGQDKGTGKIVSTPSAGAGIGATSNNHPGGNFVIHGGTIEATGHDHCAGIGSNDGNGSDVGSFTMYNGTVTATGGSQSAGIGGGRDCDGGKITIYGGTITATGKDSSAGIGGSDASGKRADNSTIDIYGGTITATGNSKGAGIGGGEYGHATVNIYGGTITATGGKSGGAGIGSGVDGSASTVSITGGTINATASSGGKGIGDGKNTSGSTIILDYTEATKKAISVTATSFGGTVTLGKPFKMVSKSLLFQSGDVADNSYLAGGALTWWDGEGTDTAYVNAAGEDMGTQKCIPVTAVATTWSDGWYAVNGNVSIDSRIQVYGTVNLILGDGCNLNAIKGISLPEGSHLIIWQQSEGSGTLTATGAQKYHAGIGGYIKDGNDIDANYGSLTINGGKIYATGAEGAAGIGTSYGTSGTLTINGGEITATGGKYASGIGCGVDPNKGKNYDSYECYLGGTYFYGGKTTVYAGEDHNGNVLKPIGAGCALRGNVVAFFMNYDMKVIHASLGQMSYDDRYWEISNVWYGDNWVIVQPKTEGDVAYNVAIDGAEHGSISANMNMAHAGTEVTISNSPDKGYDLDALTVTDCNGNKVPTNGNKFKMPSSSVTVDATFKLADYTVTIANDSEYGTVTADKAMANYGDTVALTLNPFDELCILEELTVRDAKGKPVDVSGSNTFTMPASDVTVTSNFVKSTFKILKSVDGDGTVSVASAASGSGAIIDMTFSANEGWRFKSVTVKDSNNQDVPVTDNRSFTMPESDVTIYAVFEPAYTVTCSADHGTVTADKDGAVAGETVTLMPNPAEGYTYVAGTLAVADESGSPVTVNGDNTFTMPNKPVTATAEFEAVDQTLNLNLVGAGFGSYKVSVNGADTTVTANTSINVKTDEQVTVTFMPEEYGRLNRFSVGSEQLEDQIENNTYAFTMPASSTTASAEFETSERTLRMALNGGKYGDCTISVNGVEKARASEADALTVKVGDKITIAFNPTANGQVEEFYFEDENYFEHHHEGDIQDSQYSFTMPARPANTLWVVAQFGYRQTKETVSYIDEYGQPQSVEAFVLSGNETLEYSYDFHLTLGEEIDNGPFEPTPVDTWYVVKDNVTYSTLLDTNMVLKGHVHIIVADDATLTVKSAIKDGALSVYGQAGGTGKIVAGRFTGTGLNVCGGGLQLDTVQNGEAGVNVKGGSLNVNGNVLCGDLDISGGITSIVGKAEAGTVTLGCGDTDDSITIGTYVFEGSHVSIVEGQILAGSNGQEYAGLLSSFSRGLNGTTLRLAACEVTVTNGTGGGRYVKGESVTITANEPAAGNQFEGWTGTDGLTFTSGSAITPTATFTMPARDVKVTATYEGSHCALTFYEDTAGTKVWRQAMLDYGASLSGYENYGMQGSDLLTKDGYTFAGWATEPNIVVDSLRDKNGNLNPALVGKLVEWSGTIKSDIDAYPIWIRDRLEVVINPAATGVSIADAQALSFSVNIDEKIVMRYLKDATRAGYDLAGWYTEGGVLWNGEDWEALEYASEGWTEIAGWGVTPEYCDRGEDGEPIKRTNVDRKFDYYTVTLTAHWTPKKVPVEYVVGEDGAGVIVDDRTYGLGDAITVAIAPTPKEGKAFAGWKVGAAETLYSPGSLFAFDDWSLVGNDGKLTFAAQYSDVQATLFTVSFDANGGSQVDPIRVPAGSKIASPATAKDGYDFDGWYDGDAKAEFPYAVEGDKALTAHWKERQKYTISFDSAGGTPVDDIELYAGEEVNAPAPEKDHYIFDGWYPALPATMPAKNLEVAATWIPRQYSIAFNSAGGTYVQPIRGNYGDRVDAPEDPTKDEAVFAGWLDVDKNEVTFPLYMPDTNPTFTAKWKIAQLAPAVNVKALSEVSVQVTNPAEGAEFIIVPAGEQPGPKDWANAKRAVVGLLVFGGLSPGTSYDVWGRMAETDDAAVSAAAKASVTTPKEQQEEPVPDPIKPETDRFAIETREGAPVIHSDNMADVAEATLTQDDFDEGYSLLLVSSLFGEGGVPEGDRIALSDKAKEFGAAEGVWFDVSLYKVQGENVTKLDAVPTLVNITAQVPESLRKDGRTFYLLYAHNGKATNAADGAGDTLAWKTDVFSTYLLAYKDKESPNPDKAADDTEKADTKASKAATKSSSSPAKTGDKLQMMVIALAATTIAAGAVAIAIALRRKRED